MISLPKIFIYLAWRLIYGDKINLHLKRKIFISISTSFCILRFFVASRT